jgi:3-deoxy-D-manno-octulosonate 8-phosphate phosphatase KdsC-like HAD superfamily phosphatase
MAVANARAELKKGSHYIAPHSGGDGALRDAVEYILKAQGIGRARWKSDIGERGPNRPENKRWRRPSLH